MIDLKLSRINNGANIYNLPLIKPLSLEEKEAVDILETLKRRGFETYFAGGSVRDMLLGLPSHDIDIVTAATPDEISRLFSKTYDRGRQFGVIAVISDKHEFEVATFRSDLGIVDHRHPKTVKFTSAKEDALRRDFTINGLFYDPLKKEVIDYVGGVEDLFARKLDFIGEPEDRINEDYLRMLRAVRFSARFQLDLNEKGQQAIKENSDKITFVSTERIRDEISKILTNVHRVKGLEALERLGLMAYILPELIKLHDVKQAPEFHSEGDVWDHTMLASEQLPDQCSDELAWTVLLHDIAKPETQGFRDHPKSKITFFEHDVLSAKKAEDILKRLKFSNEFIAKVSWSISQHMRIVHAFKGMSERKIQKLFSDPNIDLLLEHTRADLLASLRKDGKPELIMYEEAIKLRDKVAKNVSEEEKRQVKKFSLVTGNDIISILNIKPGPKVGQIKAKIEQAYLDGKISTRDQALKMIKELGE